MPNRFLKESICTSEEIDRLSPFAEITFYRLIVNCDDFGRYDARPKLLASRLFPLRDVTTNDIQNALAELSDAGLIDLYEVDKKPYLQMKTWDKHQQKRSDKSKFPDPADGTCYQPITDDNKCKQEKTEDSKCARIRNTYSYNDNRNSYSSSAREENDDADLSDDEAHKTQEEQNQVLNAAENAGFQMSNSVRARLIALYADSGLVKLLEGINSCVKHGATNLAYLEAVLRGAPKKPKPKVNAQDYDQRDYDQVTDELMQEQIRDMEAWMQRSG